MCPTGIVASVPITWQQASEWIAEGTVESLSRLRRSAAQLAAYRSAMEEVKQRYASVSDYVKASVLGAPMAPNGEGKLAATEVPASSPPEAAAAANDAVAAAAPTGETAAERRLIWRPNDFPYYFEAGIEHHLMWCTEPLAADEIQRLVREKLDGVAPTKGEAEEANGNSTGDGDGNGDGDGAHGGAQRRRRQHLVFVNPAPLQSVLAVWHAHVLVRDAPEEGA